MNRQMLLTHLVCIVLAGSHVTCSIADFDEDDSERIPLTKDIREYARQARAGLASLSPEQRALVAPNLLAHEQAIARYDRLLAKGKARRRWQGPLIGTSAFLLADDVTGFGVANDIAIPFLALGAVAVTLVTSAPASKDALQMSRKDVLDTAEAVSRAMESSKPRDWSRAPARPRISETADTHEKYQKCHDLMQACLAITIAQGGISTSACVSCAQQCRGSNEGEWPDTKACDYKKRSKRTAPRKRRRKR